MKRIIKRLSSIKVGYFVIVLIMLCQFVSCNVSHIDSNMLFDDKSSKETQARLYPISVNLKFGYIDQHGKVVISPKFIEAYPFHEGLARVKIQDKYGYIDGSGNLIIPAKFDNGREFADSLAAVETNRKWGYVNRSGHFVIDAKFDKAASFIEGLAAVEIDNNYGFIDKNGKTAIGFKYYSVLPFFHGVAPVRLNNALKMILIDKSGNVISSKQYDFIFEFSDGCARFVRKDDKEGVIMDYVDVDGNELNILRRMSNIDYFGDFSQGVAPVSSRGKFGFINKQGDWVIDPKFEYAQGFHDDLCVVKIDGLYGYININGDQVIPPSFAFAGNFEDGIAEVQIIIGKYGKNGYINKNGEYIWRPTR